MYHLLQFFLGLSDRKCRRKPSKHTENRGIRTAAPYDDPKQHTAPPRWWLTPSQPPGPGGKVCKLYKLNMGVGRVTIIDYLLKIVANNLIQVS